MNPPKIGTPRASRSAMPAKTGSLNTRAFVTTPALNARYSRHTQENFPAQRLLEQPAVRVDICQFRGLADEPHELGSSSLARLQGHGASHPLERSRGGRSG